MMGGTGFRDKFRSIASNLIVFSLVLGGISLFTGDEVLAQDDLILRIGSQDEPKTRNILAAVDVWTHNVLDPVYDTVTKSDPVTDELLPYILLGTDYNGDGAFQDMEYGVFKSIMGRPLEVTAFYDFNYVYFHDGYQAIVDDLLFSYHLFARDPKAHSLDVLKDKNNLPGSTYEMDRFLHLLKLQGFDAVADWSITKDYSDPGYNITTLLSLGRDRMHFSGVSGNVQV
jgi:hypothetical protein